VSAETDELARFSKLFGALDEPGRKKLMDLSHKAAFASGATICKEGDKGAEFYVVVKGKVKVSGDDLLGRNYELATLGPGEFFGELAALSGQRRQATVVALEDVEVICFPPAAVTEVVSGSKAALDVLHKAGLKRTEDTMKKMMD